MTPNQLRTAGEALFGKRWQRPLAAEIGVNDRTVRRWANDEWPVPATMTALIRLALEERRLAIGWLLLNWEKNGDEKRNCSNV